MTFIPKRVTFLFILQRDLGGHTMSGRHTVNKDVHIASTTANRSSKEVNEK